MGGDPAGLEPGEVFWHPRVGNGGWVRVEQHTADGDRWWLLVRVAPDGGGRLRIMELYLDDLDSETPVTSQRLRKLPLGRIEQLLNLPEERAGITDRLDIEGIDIKTVAGRYRTTPAREPARPLDRAARDRLRRAARHQHAAATVSHNIENRQPLSRPDQRPYPPGFYQRVAEAYRAAQREGVGPGRFIAEEAGVPRSTAAFWIRETRRRGYLGQATRGKTGETGELTLRYVGTRDTVEVPLPDGRTLRVNQGDTTQVPIDLALGLLPQQDNHKNAWEPIPQPPGPTNPQQQPAQPQRPPQPQSKPETPNQPDNPDEPGPAFQGGLFG